MGGGGHTVSNIIIMAFSPRNIVGCLLKKRLRKEGSRAPQDPPLVTPFLFRSSLQCLSSGRMLMRIWVDRHITLIYIFLTLP